MNASNETVRENDPPRDADATLRAAILRIGSSLDVDTVLKEAIESGRALTGARYGLIATVDEAGQPQDFLGSGFSADELRLMTQWTDGPTLFAHLRDLPGPLRLPDLADYVGELGFSPLPAPTGTLQATPLRHRDAVVGAFFLGAKEGGFTDDDEETLVLFAQQAAAAIVNARTHRDVRRANADLEALIETSPVGVAVIDAATSVVLSLNREAKRIVAELRTPGRPVEELPEAIACRRGDGREATLAGLTAGETVHAEEVEIFIPGGRSVRTLLHATPIRAEGGEVERVVVILQDLAPFEALERSRAEFLDMVSHELRAPLAAIKGSASTVLGAARALDPAELRQFFRIVEEQADRMNGLLGDLLEAGRLRTGTLAVAPVPAALADLVEEARTAFPGEDGHTIQVDLPADLPPVMADGRRIVQVLNNLLANAARHSPRTAPIRVTAARDGAQVEVSVADEGEGVSPERLPHLFRRLGAARKDGGSGLGLAICKGLVEAHGGRIRAERGATGRGLRVTFTLPVAEEAAPAAVPGVAAKEAAPDRIPVLVVDDDPAMLRHVRDALAAAGYAPAVTAEPGEVARLVEEKKPRLVLLDLMLPGTDGIALMESMPALAHIPVIFISAYGRDETIARALEAGAADYVVKPFSPTELVARVGAALRRRADARPFRIGELVIDYVRRRVTVAGHPVRLTATEYELLRALAADAGGVSTYASLLHRVWGEPAGDNLQPVRSVVKKLRRKLGDDATKPRYILNERGLGYRMPAPGDP